MDIITKLPEDIQRYIYEFDPTYKIKYSYCMVSIKMMLKRLLESDNTIVQIKTYKKLFYSCVYLPEYFQKISFEYTRNHLKVLENVKHFNTDNDNFYRHHRCEDLNDGYHSCCG